VYRQIPEKQPLIFSLLTIAGWKGQVGRHMPKGVSVYTFWPAL